MSGAIAEAAPAGQSNLGVARLQEQLAERDEIIVALQHVIQDLRHEIDNLHAEDSYARFVRADVGGRAPVRRAYCPIGDSVG